MDSRSRLQQLPGREWRCVIRSTGVIRAAGIVLAAGCTLMLPSATAGTEGHGSYPLLRDFADDWMSSWKQRSFGRGPNELRVVEENGNPALELRSATTASGLWRKLKIEPLEAATLSWRWKVERSLPNIYDERTPQGDDYAARVFVIYESSWLLPLHTRAICYVWSAKEPVGAVYPNPYAGKVATFVLRSGDRHAGQWMREERDLVADHIAIFGEPPTKIAAFAVMVDTDHTGTETITRFDDLVLDDL